MKKQQPTFRNGVMTTTFVSDTDNPNNRIRKIEFEILDATTIESQIEHLEGLIEFCRKHYMKEEK